MIEIIIIIIRIYIAPFHRYMLKALNNSLQLTLVLRVLDSPLYTAHNYFPKSCPQLVEETDHNTGITLLFVDKCCGFF